MNNNQIRVKEEIKMKYSLCGIAFLAIAASVAVVEPAKQAPKKSRVPDTLPSSVRLIDPAAQKVNHILVVNVGDAIPATEWPLIVTYAASRLQLNIWTNSVPKALYPEILSNPKVFTDKFGPKARVGILLEDADDELPYVCVPGSWCRVNLRHLKADSPDSGTLRDRRAKAILKGLSYACGGGFALDSRSSTFYGSLTLKGLDKTTITITPESYFPMTEAVRALGGEEMANPARTEEE